MIGLLLALGMAGLGAPAQDAQVQPCVWPNRCAQAPAVWAAQVQPCVWPNRCTDGLLPEAA